MKKYHVLLIGFVLLTFTGALMRLEQNPSYIWFFVSALVSLGLSITFFLTKQKKEKNTLV